ncbi:hypothetical protein JKP88DRAFT_177954 [Tribonema minus]|uniref:RNA polymerase sigma-70 domain-containing protein n=1 Tax=Tribonema minus TaxID=303371 RepID=A0A835Z811_9STRA|nr:hypothetical protein JKP88DRAFT_177954 [Tribonema minus]
MSVATSSAEAPRQRQQQQQRGRKRGRKPKAEFSEPSAASQPNAEFFAQLRSTRLLSAEEELRLGALVQELVAAEARCAALAEALGREPTLAERAADAGAASEALYTARLRRGLWAKRAMVTCNLRLVVALAAKFQGQGPPLADLIQEGAVGLVRAAEKYDPARGFRFSTYATWWVRQRLHLSVRSHRLVRVPLRVHSQFEALRRAVRALAGELGRRPTEGELAARCGLTPARAAHVRAAMLPPESLDRELHFASHRSEQGLVTMLDVTPAAADDGTSAGTATMEQALEWDLLREDLERAMRASLSQRERDIVRMRVGLDDGRAKTATELAAVFQLPAYVILREERNALTKLRVAPDTLRLRDYAELIDALS